MTDVMLSEIDQELIGRLVNLQLLEVADFDIMRALMLSQNELDELREHIEFKRQLSVQVLSEVENNSLVDQGWDGVEALGIKTVIDSLEWNKDPDFALKAAMMANKAVRRKRGRGPLNGNASGNQHAVIHLERRFIEKVQNQHTGITRITERTESVEIPQKDVNMLNPAKVESLLAPGLRIPNQFDDEDSIDEQLEALS